MLAMSFSPAPDSWPAAAGAGPLPKSKESGSFFVLIAYISDIHVHMPTCDWCFFFNKGPIALGVAGTT